MEVASPSSEISSEDADCSVNLHHHPSARVRITTRRFEVPNILNQISIIWGFYGVRFWFFQKGLKVSSGTVGGVETVMVMTLIFLK